jgi:hypothetical protein
MGVQFHAELLEIKDVEEIDPHVFNRAPEHEARELVDVVVGL